MEADAGRRVSAAQREMRANTIDGGMCYSFDGAEFRISDVVEIRQHGSSVAHTLVTLRGGMQFALLGKPAAWKLAFASHMVWEDHNI